MQDLYGSDKRIAGVFKGTQASLTVGGTAGAQRGALVQNIALSYNRQVTRILELGSEDQYYVIGSSEGQGNIGSILGPRNTVITMLKELGDACGSPNRSVMFEAASEFCEDGGDFKAEATGAILTGFNVSVAAQDFLVQQGGTLMFATLDVS